MSKKTQTYWIAAVIALFLAVALLFWNRTKARSVDVASAKTGDIVEAIYGLGTITANQTFQLKIGVTTTIREVFVREGDGVKAGAPLVRLDEGNVFRSPFGGTVTSLPYKVGETVFPQMPIVTVMNLIDRYVVVSLEQEGALRVRPGQTARMTVESLRGQTFTGKVRTLFPGDNQFLVHIDVPQLPAEIIPGMTGDVAIEVARKQNVLMVPVAAIQSGKVTIKTGHATKKVALGLGAIDGRWAEVISGDVRAGDEVMIPAKK